MRIIFSISTAALLITAVSCKGNSGGVSYSDLFGDEERLGAMSPRGTAPMFAVTPDGKEALAWVSSDDGGSDSRLYISVDNADAVEITDPLGPIEGHGEAPPKLVVGGDGQMHSIYVVSRLEEGRKFPASALRYISSSDKGKSWSSPITVSDNGDFGSHNFHALSVSDSGHVYVSWLDGRHNQSAAYVAVSHDAGKSFSANIRADTTAACPCCRTAIAPSRDGALYMAWRSILPGSVRDIVIARSDDGGMSWSEPIPVNNDGWVFEGCPHAGPSLQVDGKGRVHISWWTGVEGASGVKYARSDDGARTFNPPIELGVADFSRPAHVQLALVQDDSVVVVWDDGTVEVPQVVMRTSGDGGLSFRDKIVLSSADRAATFPVVATAPAGLTVAWSEQAPESLLNEERSRPDMSDPNARMGLKRVGDMEIVIRRARP